MFVTLTDFFKKDGIAINSAKIEYITEYDIGAKVRTIKDDGSFMKDFYVAESILEVCEIINKAYQKNKGELTIYHKKSLFD
jgi:hypothetical protein